MFDSERISSISYLTLILLLISVILLIPLARPILSLDTNVRIAIGIFTSLGFIYFCLQESKERKDKYLALAISMAILAMSAINTSLVTTHIIAIGASFISVLILPTLIIKDKTIIHFKLLPNRLDKFDLIYTVISIPLAYFAFKLYFENLSPQIPYNWVLPGKPNNNELVKLFMGINAVGIWDELFFINISFAILRSLFPFRIANAAQAVIYTAVLYDMAFAGWGPVFIFLLAITQGAMFERSKVLIWVLIVHLIVDFFLFQAIVQAHYPDLVVWWHPL